MYEAALELCYMGSRWWGPGGLSAHTYISHSDDLTQDETRGQKR
jgi:hypothetical protein